MRRHSPVLTVPATCALIVATFLAAAGSSRAGEVNLSWDPSTGAAGYRVFAGSGSGNYGTPLDVGNTTQTNFGGMTDCQATYFAVKAYNAAGESGLSNEISSWPRPEIGSTGVPWVERGQQYDLTLTGLNFQSGATAVFSSPQISVTSLSRDACNQISLSISVSLTAPIGDASVSVINPNGVTGVGFAFRVEPVGGPDTDPPGTPGGLTGEALSWQSVQLSWNPSSDGNGTGTAGYKVYRDGILIGSTPDTEFLDTGLEPESSYSYTVSAYDGASPPNESAQSQAVNVTTAAAPAVLLRVNVGGSAYVDGSGQTWSADYGFNTGTTDLSSNPIAGTSDDALYQAARWDPSAAPELEYAFTVPNGSYTVNLLFAETYSGAMGVGQRVFDVEIEGQPAFDNLDVYAEAGGNTALVKTYETTVGDGQINIAFFHVVQNPQLAGIEILTSGPDTFAPDVPQGLSGTPLGSDSIELTWSASVDNGGSGVAGYHVFRDGQQIATTTGTSYLDSSLSPATTYSYQVSAFDGATPPNESARSTAVGITTQDVSIPLGNVGNLRRTDTLP